MASDRKSMIRAGQALEAAAAAYAANDRAKAETLCRAALRAQAENYEALNLLGILRSRRANPCR